jgi:hypothetical protein
VAERLNAAALKAVRRRKASRGFESHPLRFLACQSCYGALQPRSRGLDLPWWTNSLPWWTDSYLFGSGLVSPTWTGASRITPARHTYEQIGVAMEQLGAMIVSTRGAPQTVESLGMQSDSKHIPVISAGQTVAELEIPLPLSDSKPDGWWLIDECVFTASEAISGDGSDEQISGMRGGGVISIVDGRCIGILSPEAATSPLFGGRGQSALLPSQPRDRRGCSKSVLGSSRSLTGMTHERQAPRRNPPC